MAKAAPKKINSGLTPSKPIMPVYVKSPVKAYTSNIGRSRVPTLKWESPEWDLGESGRIIDVEGIVRRAFSVKKNLFIKEGYEFVSANLERSKYIKERFRQIERATKKPSPILMSETLASLVRCSNAFWVKVRDKNASGGKVRLANRKELNPVAGYYLMPAETVRFKRDEFGTVKKYRQELYGKAPKEFAPEDVVHFYFDKREGFAVGTPSLVPVKDDIRALRRIEENVEALIYQHLFPLFHYQVGTDDHPAGIGPDGVNEVEKVQYEVARMPSDGCWVTPERHKITAIQASSAPIAVDKVIEHFKSRIYIGLGVSPIDLGEGGKASRSTAQTLSQNLIDAVKSDQKHFGALFFTEVINELLSESTFSESDLFAEENLVFLKFREIDIQTQLARENHLTDIFLKNVITHDEARMEMGRQPFLGDGWPTGTKKSQMFGKGDGDWARTSYGMIERDKVILQALDEPGTDASQSEAKSRTTANKTKSAGGNSVANKNQPANQSGTRKAAKTNKDSFAKELVNSQILPVSDYFSRIKDELIERVSSKGIEKQLIKANLTLAFGQAGTRLKRLSRQAFIAGLAESNKDSWELDMVPVEARIFDNIDKYIRKYDSEIYNSIMRHTIKEQTTKTEDSLFVKFIFDNFQHRSKMIEEAEITRAYNFGLAKGFKLIGYSEIASVANEDSCNRCKNTILKYNLRDAIIYEELPPHHPNCTCRMKITLP